MPSEYANFSYWKISLDNTTNSLYYIITSKWGQYINEQNLYWSANVYKKVEWIKTKRWNIKRFAKAQKLLVPLLNKQEIGDDGKLTTLSNIQQFSH